MIFSKNLRASGLDFHNDHCKPVVIAPRGPFKIFRSFRRLLEVSL